MDQFKFPVNNEYWEKKTAHNNTGTINFIYFLPIASFHSQNPAITTRLFLSSTLLSAFPSFSPFTDSVQYPFWHFKIQRRSKSNEKAAFDCLHCAMVGEGMRKCAATAYNVCEFIKLQNCIKRIERERERGRAEGERNKTHYALNAYDSRLATNHKNAFARDGTDACVRLYATRLCK